MTRLCEERQNPSRKLTARKNNISEKQGVEKKRPVNFIYNGGHMEKGTQNSAFYALRPKFYQDDSVCLLF